MRHTGQAPATTGPADSTETAPAQGGGVGTADPAGAGSHVRPDAGRAAPGPAVGPVPGVTQPPPVLPDRVTAPPRLAERHPALYPLAVRVHRARRRVAWWRSDAVWAGRPAPGTAPETGFRVTKHRSLLMRTLGESEMWLQRNKVTNLRLACEQVDGVLIRPGETFSFNKVVGNCTRRRGYVAGMRLSNGVAAAGVGGGICQLANLLVWMFMHSELSVLERSEHSFDPFPDNQRVLPWGVGCSIVYNYVDLVVRNDTETTFRIDVGVGERYLEGELRADREQRHSFSVHARDERFLRRGDQLFRSNEIWREVIDRRTGAHLGAERIRANCALVRYEPVGVPIVDVPEQG